MSKLGGSFFLQWVTAVTVTMIVAVMGAFASMWSIGEVVQRAWGDVAAALVVGAIFGGLLGLGISLGQALVLRAYGIPLGRWLGQAVLAGAVGAAISFLVMFNILDMDNVPQAVAALAITLSVGPPIGLVQWRLLKPHIAQAQLWIPILTIALFIAFVVGLPLGGEGQEWLSVGVIALLTAVISGGGMVWLLQGGETAVAA
jgi:hypothetical protein